MYVGAYGQIDRIGPALPGYGGFDHLVASADGSELYDFDILGRHLRTLDPTTGVTRYTFGYDAGGRLNAVTDASGNATAVVRDASGFPSAILAPFGQSTALTLDANGYLGGVSDPAGDRVQFSYGVGGLLATFSDARDYDAGTGRWTAKDPLHFVDDEWNVYTYVNNGPVNYIDPSGFILQYADPISERILKLNINEIMKAPKGQELLAKLHKDPKIYLIHGGPGPSGPAYQLDQDVYVDPTFHPNISTDCGKKPASTTRILAHELGHFTGVQDDGPEGMNNVNAWENPIMVPLEGYRRTRY